MRSRRRAWTPVRAGHWSPVARPFLSGVLVSIAARRHTWRARAPRRRRRITGKSSAGHPSSSTCAHPCGRRGCAAAGSSSTSRLRLHRGWAATLFWRAAPGALASRRPPSCRSSRSSRAARVTRMPTAKCAEARTPDQSAVQPEIVPGWRGAPVKRSRGLIIMLHLIAAHASLGLCSALFQVRSSIIILS